MRRTIAGFCVDSGFENTSEIPPDVHAVNRNNAPRISEFSDGLQSLLLLIVECEVVVVVESEEENDDENDENDDDDDELVLN